MNKKPITVAFVSAAGSEADRGRVSAKLASWWSGKASPEALAAARALLADVPRGGVHVTFDKKSNAAFIYGEIEDVREWCAGVLLACTRSVANDCTHVAIAAPPVPEEYQEPLLNAALIARFGKPVKVSS